MTTPNLPLIVMLLAIVIRAIVSIKAHEASDKESFSFRYYFTGQRSFRWLVHLFSCTLGYLLLPELFALLKQYARYDFSEFTAIGCALIGYAGYDFIKLLEQGSFFFAKKVGIPLEEWVTKVKKEEQDA